VPEPSIIPIEVVAHVKILFASALGGMVRLFLRPARTISQAVMLVIACVTCGYYGQPILTWWLQLPDNFDGAIGALLGLIGVSIAERALKAADGLDIDWNRMFRLKKGDEQ
jgi:hypothetical protein